MVLKNELKKSVMHASKVILTDSYIFSIPISFGIVVEVELAEKLKNSSISFNSLLRFKY